MKTIKTVTREVDHVTHLECDLCHRRASAHSAWGDEYAYAFADTSMYAHVGTIYPDGGTTVRTEFDICPKCFADKVIPWLTAQGAVPKITTHDH